MAKKQKLIDKLKDAKFYSVINAILKYGLTSHKTFASLADSDLDEKKNRLRLHRPAKVWTDPTDQKRRCVRRARPP